MVLKLLSYLPFSTPALLQLIHCLAESITLKKIKSVQSLVWNPAMVFNHGLQGSIWLGSLLSLWPHLLTLSDSPNLPNLPLPCCWCLNVPSILPPKDLCTDYPSTQQGNIFIQMFAWQAPSSHSGLSSNSLSLEGSSHNHHALYLALIFINLNIY